MWERAAKRTKSWKNLLWKINSNSHNDCYAIPVLVNLKT